jgi:hypothetical protein
MRIFARIENGIVAELLATEHDIATMFHPALHWVEATHVNGVAPGWRHDGTNFTAPEATPGEPARTQSAPEATQGAPEATQGVPEATQAEPAPAPASDSAPHVTA